MGARPPCHLAEEAEAGLLGSKTIIPGYLLDSGEIVILALRPSVWFLMFVSIRWLLAAALVIGLAPVVAPHFPAMLSETTLTQAAFWITATRLLVALLQWSSRLYVLTNRRVMSYRGVVHVTIFEAPLVQIRNTYVRDGWAERFLRVGSIGFAVGASKRVDSWWDQIANPQEVHHRVRRAIENALDQHPPL